MKLDPFNPIARIYFVCSAKASGTTRTLSFQNVLSYTSLPKLPVVPQNDNRAVTRPSDCSGIPR
ncbi:MAG: hypothetical protein ACK5RV_01265 [Flavobacterium sp.]|uniref:hypothetical protein n=1 Tax=Flavobacterium sp. TaxID=239 RepID=UPI00391A8DD0